MGLPVARIFRQRPNAYLAKIIAGYFLAVQKRVLFKYILNSFSAVRFHKLVFFIMTKHFFSIFFLDFGGGVNGRWLHRRHCS